MFFSAFGRRIVRYGDFARQRRRSSVPSLGTYWIVVCSIFACQINATSAKDVPFVIAEVRSIHSKVLKEDRTFYIYNPDANASNRLPAYPVLYLLEENDMTMVTGLISYLSAYNEQLPAMIVVGIPGGGTVIRDRTPNHSNIDNLGNIDESPDSWLQPSGGGEAFLQFIREELMPYVEQNCKTAPFKIFAGHSVGGLSSVYCLYAHPEMFDAYVAVSPSLWWDKGFAISYAKQHSDWPTSGRNKFLFLADCPESGPFNRYIDRFNTLLETTRPRRLHYRYVHYPKETHGSTAAKAYYDAFRFLYPEWNISPTDTSARRIKQHYQKMSDRLGYSVEPPLGMVNDWASRFLNDPKKLDDAIELYKLNVANFPDSAETYEALGDAYVRKGDKGAAAANYQKALELSPANGQIKEKLKSVR